MEYGGRKHIELLTSTLNLLSYRAEHEAEPPDPREVEEASQALHAALLCHTRPVPLPPDFVILGGDADASDDATRALSN